MENYRVYSRGGYDPYGQQKPDAIAIVQDKMRTAPRSGSRGLLISSGGGRQPAIRIYVTLKKNYEGDDDYK